MLLVNNRFEIRLSEEVPPGLYYRKIENMSNTKKTPSPIIEPKRQGRLTDVINRLWREKPLGTACGMIIFLFIVVAIFADVLAPHDYRKRHLPDRMQGSSIQYLLGTDHLGRDLLSRLIVGARISLTVGLAATALNVIVAVLIGGTFGFLGGKPDLAAQRFVDAWMAFPGLLLLLTIMSIVGRGLFQITISKSIASRVTSLAGKASQLLPVEIKCIWAIS